MFSISSPFFSSSRNCKIFDTFQTHFPALAWICYETFMAAFDFFLGDVLRVELLFIFVTGEVWSAKNSYNSQQIL